MCRAYDDADGTWLVNPMFIEPLPQRSEPYPFSSTGYTRPNGSTRPVLPADGTVIPDQKDTAFCPRSPVPPASRPTNAPRPRPGPPRRRHRDPGPEGHRLLTPVPGTRRGAAEYRSPAPLRPSSVTTRHYVRCPRSSGRRHGGGPMSFKPVVVEVHRHREGPLEPMPGRPA